ncbi:YlxQ family RNA-binding protein [Brevibacillus sp. B_LB10_24]|uniref:YlxQ family RNA-binding protein n=1 Tax=Brevibacillus sp. B_LB10_24 TaxID=3380645 RepID=UPI0038B949B7
MNQKLGQLLGIAMRARKIITGEELVIRAIRTKRAHLVLLASDASSNTAKKVSDKCSYYGVPFCMLFDRYEIGRAIGKDARVAVAVVDAQIADRIQHFLHTPNS